MLDTRCEDDQDFLLIEDVIFLGYDLDYSWMNLILRMFSFFTCDLDVHYVSWFQGYK